jgi:hypothetical protein
MRVGGFVALLFVASNRLPAADTSIDLGSPGTQQETDVIAGKPLTLAIVNLVPSARYRWVVRREAAAIEPLSPPSAPAADVSGRSRKCQELQGLVNALRDAKLEETRVHQIVREVDGVLDAARQDLSDCPATVQEAEQLRGRTEWPIGTWVLEDDERLVVVVERLDADGKAQKTWSHTFQTASGHWSASYGFVFTDDRDQRYFSKAMDVAGEFQIERQAGTRSLSFVPMVFYSWEPRRGWPGHGFSLGPTGGLGFDTESPAVALGLSLTYHHNLSLVGGGVIRKFKQLSGIYDSAQLPITVHEDLSSDQLTEDAWKPAWFFGLAIRFGKSPFSGSSGAATSGGKPTNEKKAKDET